ncbi:MAG: hypothetical protein K9G11_00915 [Rickettsiaceae bacterium]|nr:hypothetical protein [Rickettsiaceae bacterium]
MMITGVLYFLVGILFAAIGLFIFSKSTGIKILYLNFANNLVVLIIVAMGSLKYRQDFFDIAIIYILLSFITNRAILRYGKIE